MCFRGGGNLKYDKYHRQVYLLPLKHLEVKCSVFLHAKSEHTLNKIHEIVCKFANYFLQNLPLHQPLPSSIQSSLILQFILFWKLSYSVFFSWPNILLPFIFFNLQSLLSLLSLFSHNLTVEADQIKPVPGIALSSTFRMRDWQLEGRFLAQLPLDIKGFRWAMVMHAVFLTLGFPEAYYSELGRTLLKMRCNTKIQCWLSKTVFHRNHWRLILGLK